MFFAWSHDLIKAGKKKPLEMNDLSDLTPKEDPRYSYEKMSEAFESYPHGEPKRILKSFRKYLGPLFILAGILATIANCLQFAGPIVIGKVL